MFDFGTKFGVPLAYRNGFTCHGAATLTDVALPSESGESSKRQKIKSITAKEIKRAFSDKNDLRDSVFNDLHDSDLSDSQF